MEDKRTAFAILLCTTLVIMYSQIVFAPYQQRAQQIKDKNATQQQVLANSLSQTQVTQGQQGTIQQINPQQNQQVANTVATNTALLNKIPSLSEINSAGIKKIHNQKFEVVLTLLGGRVQSLKLNDYKKNLKDTENLNLVSSFEGVRLPLGVSTNSGNDLNTNYKIINVSGFTLYNGQQNGTNVLDINSTGDLLAVAPEGASIELQGILSNGNTINKKLTFYPANFHFKVEVTVTPPQNGTVIEPIYIEWSEFIPESVLHERYDPRQFTLLNKEGDLKHTMLSTLKNGVVQNEGNSQWVSVTDRYFVSSIVPDNKPALSMLSKEGETFFVKVGGTPETPGTSLTTSGFNIYVGPKNLEDLKMLGASLERSIDLGFFSFISYPLLSLINFFYSLLHNYGLAIIALTLLIKLAFLPLTSASMKAGKAMQTIQPEIAELRSRIKDSTQLNQEMMALYKKRGVNPMAGCFPVMIQIPVFFGLYQALLNSINLRHAPFALWINDLSSPEKLQVFGIGIPLMILLMGASMYFQQKLQPSTLDPQQQKIMNLMPLIFTGMFIVYPMPSGLVLYWLVNNAISIVQQTSLKKEGGRSPLETTIIASVIIFVVGYVLTKL